MDNEIVNTNKKLNKAWYKTDKNETINIPDKTVGKQANLTSFKKGESGNAERIIKFPIKTEEKREYHNNFKKEKIANAVKMQSLVKPLKPLSSG